MCTPSTIRSLPPSRTDTSVRVPLAPQVAWGGSGGHEKVTSECSWCISKNEYEKAHRYIDEVKKNIKYYGLTGNQCTSTAAKIAKKAGVNVNPYVILSLPRSLSEKNILWTNPKYNRITFALPDKMQDIMKHAGNDRVKSCR